MTNHGHECRGCDSLTLLPDGSSVPLEASSKGDNTPLEAPLVFLGFGGHGACVPSRTRYDGTSGAVSLERCHGWWWWVLVQLGHHVGECIKHLLSVLICEG